MCVFRVICVYIGYKIIISDLDLEVLVLEYYKLDLFLVRVWVMELFSMLNYCDYFWLNYVIRIVIIL